MLLKINKFSKRYFKTIGFKLAVWYSGFFFVGSLCVIGLVYLFLSNSLKEEDRANITKELQELSQEYMSNGLKNFASMTQREGSISSDSFYVRVISENGNVIFNYEPGIYDRFILPKVLPEAKNKPVWDFIKAQGEEDILELLSAPMADGAVIQVGLSTQRRENFLKNFLDSAIIVMLPTFFLALIVGTSLTNRSLKPLRHLIETVKSIESGHLESRVPIQGTGDELDEAGTLFNKALDRISSLVSGMRQAIDNVAHDLRTPMMRLRAIAETALTSKTSFEKRGEALSDCLEEVQRIIVLLNTLMEVSEAETGVIKLRRESVRLADVIEEVAEVYRYVAEEKNISIKVKIESDITVSCDRARIRQALANLIDNAVKYSPAKKSVSISLRAEGDKAVFSVLDEGTGISPGDIEHIWDRLFRGDMSRHEKGLGLGLSLVRAVALAHGGSVEVSSKVGKGSLFTLIIPADSKLTERS